MMMDVYNPEVVVPIIRDGVTMHVMFKYVKAGDILPTRERAIVSDDAHLSDDADYSGYLFYDKDGGRYFPEDFEAAGCNAPSVLYHATYQAYLPSIIANGLGARQTKNWDASVDGVVCLAETAEQAESFAESAEDASSDVYDSGIVILQVDASNLALRPDRNILPPENRDITCWEYSGTIAPSRLTALP